MLMSSNRSFILSATDFSPAAIEASTVAAKLSLCRSQPLRLVHVSGATSETAVGVERSHLEAEAQRLRDFGVEVEALLVQSARPAEALLEHIRTDLPSLVIVSSSVKGPIDRWALGSFSERVAESSPVPTLVVRNPAGFKTWDWVKDRLTVLLALDLYSSSDAVLRWAKDFRMAGPCDLIACHVNNRAPTAEEISVAPGRPVNPPALQSRLERELHKKVRDQLGDDLSTVVVKPHFGDPAPAVVEIAGEVNAQLIAVGAHQRHGLSRLTQFSVSRELLHNAALNVVCVPVTAKFDPREAHIPEFRRVLVATDFSELGNAAIPFACAACSIGGLVKIIHVARPRIRSLRTAGAGWSSELRMQLQSLVPHETAARCQPPQVDVLEDRNVAAALCAEAERFGADLVCLSSHGLGASRALHGSVTKRVLKEIRRPLLVIRRPEE
jgi:nucleotide-binding universal stress UspA family protein